MRVPNLNCFFLCRRRRPLLSLSLSLALPTCSLEAFVSLHVRLALLV